jgi:hypothetical protein
MRSTCPLTAADPSYRLALQEFEGATVRFGDVLDKESLRKVAFAEGVDVIVSCLASRTGGQAAAAGPRHSDHTQPSSRPCVVHVSIRRWPSHGHACARTGSARLTHDTVRTITGMGVPVLTATVPVS